MQPTNPNQFTENAWGAITRTPEIAKAANHQQIHSEHLLMALLEQYFRQAWSQRPEAARSHRIIHAEPAADQRRQRFRVSRPIP